MTAKQLDAEAGVNRRLRPLYLGVGLQNFALWVPVEKIFMTQIGFTAATIALVAAVYAAVVPLLEVPFGILADRWSRTGMMGVATVALAIGILIAGLSTSPAAYAVAAVFLGVYLALNSGTADSIVYDTLIEDTGTADRYEKHLGRLHGVEAAALGVSALAGGLLAALSSPRATYFVTIPIVLMALLAFRVCREPSLHRAGERITYRQQARVTLRALSAGGSIRRAVVLTALVAAGTQMLIEFGPLWLVALHAPTGIYGPYLAVQVGMLGFGAWLAGRVSLARPVVAVVAGATLLITAILPAVSASLGVVIAAQVLATLALAMIGVRAGFLLHNAVAASVRAGVSSGASTLSFLVFLPLSLVFSPLSRAAGVQGAGWLLVVLALPVAFVLMRSAQGGRQAAERVGADPFVTTG